VIGPGGLIRGAVRAVEVLKPAIGALDLAGLSWRRLRAYSRGAGCLADCGEGHTFGPWCQLGYPLPGPSYLINALADATMPLPPAAKELEHEQLEAIHAALTQVGTSWLEAMETPVDTDGDRPQDCQAAECFGIECMNECASSHRLERYLQASLDEGGPE